MKPKAQSAHEEGLLEYLEDIIGSNKYIEKIEMESENLEKVNDRRFSVVHRFKIVEKEKQSIETGRNEAIEYLKTENEVLNNEYELSNMFIYYVVTGISRSKVARNNRISWFERQVYFTANRRLVACKGNFDS